MPAPTATAITASATLSSTAAQPWTGFAAKRTWANGGDGAIGSDFDRVRGVHLPRPQLYSFPNFGMLGETQDCYAVARSAVVDQTELRHRQIIFGELMDDANMVRIAGLSRRIVAPTYCRIYVSATFAHRFQIGGGLGTDTPYFSLFYGAPGATPSEVTGARRHLARQITYPYAEAGLVQVNMLGALDTKAGALAADLEVYVALVAAEGTNLSSSTASTAKNRNRVDVLNTTFVVRVFKNVTD